MNGKSRTQTTAPQSDGGDRSGDGRPRYERPQILKRRSMVRVTGQGTSGTGPAGGQMIANGVTP